MKLLKYICPIITLFQLQFETGLDLTSSAINDLGQSISYLTCAEHFMTNLSPCNYSLRKVIHHRFYKH